jgi:hypothetical protein
MDLRQPIEQPLSARRSSQTNTAAIGRIRRPLKQALLHASIHQFHDRVVLQAKRVRSVRDRWGAIGRDTRHGQQKLMLLRMDTGQVRSILADQQEFPQLTAKRGESLMKRLVWVLTSWSFAHNNILSHHDIFR